MTLSLLSQVTDDPALSKLGDDRKQLQAHQHFLSPTATAATTTTVTQLTVWAWLSALF